MAFKKVDAKMSLPEMEGAVLKFWEENGIFEKSLENRKDCPVYNFYDGPPFATGTPHYGHLVASAMKDIVPRYWTMKGRYVPRKWGWDCHGLPIENIVEKELGSRAKKDIEKMGVKKFNELCRSKVLTYVEEWKKTVKRFGRWADMENSYKTMDLPFMESVWWVFKELYDKGLVYESYRSMHICPRCETTLSQSEVAEGYKDVKDLSVIAKFKVKYDGSTGRGVGALILNEKDEILLIHRKENGRRETWAMPGGKVDKGENFIQALEREIKEELGVEIESAEPIRHNPEFIEGRMFDTVCYLTRIKGEPKNMVPKETEKIKWFPLNNLPEIDYEPTENGIKYYLEDSKKRVGDKFSENLPQVFVLAWTTTPWTLIGNVALAIGEKVKYVLVKSEGDYYIIAEERVSEVFKSKFEKIIDIKSGELCGLRYQPLFEYYSNDENLKNRENGWKIFAGDFVTTEEGTGIVHIAPAFGEDDMNLGKEHDLPFVQHVGMDGVIKKEAGEFAGLHVKPMGDTQKTDVEIIKYLAHNNLLFSKEKYAHSYPHCWRCETPLLNYATSSWFVSVEKIKEKMLAFAKEINWSPGHLKKGRWGNWLEGARDWSISRQRFWASVMPIWKCEKCKEIKVVGSVGELEKLSGEKITDIHKHIVDEVTFQCEKCEAVMRRIPDVLDTWFDSGSMPYAQAHYPFENKEKFRQGFPAEFIAEGVDQTRAWFYYLHVIAAGIQDSPAFKNVVVNGIVLAEDGKKMAKRLKNYPDPKYVLEKYGADALRFYLTTSPVMQAENLNFKESDLAELVRGIFRMLWNSYSFFVLYASIDKFKINNEKIGDKENLLDKWIISELQTLIKEVNANMGKYELTKAARLFPKFIDNLSNWYIRRSRKRFWKSENDADKKEAYETLHYVLVTLAQLMAPFTPFVAEEIYKNLTGEESVHLSDFPEAQDNLIDEKLNKNMGAVREIISLGLQKRAEAKIKVRQPLGSVSISSKFKDLIDAMFDSDDRTFMEHMIMDELNVHSVGLNILQGRMNSREDVILDTEITEDLKLEGQAREAIRFIQEMRKEAGFEVDNRIEICYTPQSEIFEKFRPLIAKETLADEIKEGSLEKPDLEKKFDNLNVQLKRR